MATSQHQENPHYRSATVAESLARGFDSLALDPSPHLRQARKRLRRQRTFEQAWIDVGRAIAQAIRVMEQTIFHP